MPVGGAEDRTGGLEPDDLQLHGRSGQCFDELSNARFDLGDRAANRVRLVDDQRHRATASAAGFDEGRRAAGAARIDRRAHRATCGDADLVETAAGTTGVTAAVDRHDDAVGVLALGFARQLRFVGRVSGERLAHLDHPCRSSAGNRIHFPGTCLTVHHAWYERFARRRSRQVGQHRSGRARPRSCVGRGTHHPTEDEHGGRVVRRREVIRHVGHRGRAVTVFRRPRQHHHVGAVAQIDPVTLGGSAGGDPGAGVDGVGRREIRRHPEADLLLLPRHVETPEGVVLLPERHDDRTRDHHGDQPKHGDRDDQLQQGHPGIATPRVGRPEHIS